MSIRKYGSRLFIKLEGYPKPQKFLEELFECQNPAFSLNKGMKVKNDLYVICLDIKGNPGDVLWQVNELIYENA